ncbi:hypothetical protein OPT61_g10578 [Boeremia exigua]|uniref:Uncharacterized protein n=1 Tax=Boeremia exigua TaxID=749465 RepID=A0ACC2HPJ4_9PLEO|nr:hypothetical protein OPT61_g10578 [Boeremia exigua]
MPPPIAPRTAAAQSTRQKTRPCTKTDLAEGCKSRMEESRGSDVWEAGSCTSAGMAAWTSENDEPVAAMMENIVFALERLECRAGLDKGTGRDALSYCDSATHSRLLPPAPGSTLDLWIEPSLRNDGSPPPPSYDDSVADPPPDYTYTDALATAHTPEYTPFPSLNASLCSDVPNCLRMSRNTSPASSLFIDEKSLYAEIDFGFADDGVRSHAKGKKKAAAKKTANTSNAPTPHEEPPTPPEDPPPPADDGGSGGGEGGDGGDGDKDKDKDKGDEEWGDWGDAPTKKKKKSKKQAQEEEAERVKKEEEEEAAAAKAAEEEAERIKKEEEDAAAAAAAAAEAEKAAAAPDLGWANDAPAGDEWTSLGATSKKKKKKGKAAEPSPPDPPAAETFSDVNLDDGAPKIDMNFGGSGDKPDLLGGGGWSSGWDTTKESSGWGFDSTPLGGSKGASSDSPWGSTDKKKPGGDFDFQFDAFKSPAAAEPAAENAAWGFGTTKSKKKNGSAALLDDSVPDSKVEDDPWNFGFGGSKKKGAAEADTPAPEPVPEPPVEPVPEVPKVDPFAGLRRG